MDELFQEMFKANFFFQPPSRLFPDFEVTVTTFTTLKFLYGICRCLGTVVAIRTPYTKIMCLC